MQTPLKSPEKEQFMELVAKFLIELKEEYPSQQAQPVKITHKSTDLFSQRTGKSINRIEIPNLAARSSL